MKRLETQNSQQKILIDKLSPKIVPIKEDVAATPAVKETLERDPEEDAKVLKIVKEIDLKNAKLNASKNVQTKKKKTRATKVEKVKSVVKAKKTKTPAKKKAKNKKKVKSEPVEMEINGSGSTETVVAVAEEPKDELKEMKTAETFFIEAIKEIAVEAAGEIEVDDPDKDILDVIKEIDAKNDAKEIDAGKEIINAIKEIDEKSQVKKGKKKAKKKTVKKAKDATKSTETQVEANPWGSLKESTLKRKTVAQLTAYLAERVSEYMCCKLISTILNTNSIIQCHCHLGGNCGSRCIQERVSGYHSKSLILFSERDEYNYVKRQRSSRTSSFTYFILFTNYLFTV